MCGERIRFHDGMEKARQSRYGGTRTVGVIRGAENAAETRCPVIIGLTFEASGLKLRAVGLPTPQREERMSQHVRVTECRLERLLPGSGMWLSGCESALFAAGALLCNRSR